MIDKESFKIDKKTWDETLSLQRKQLLKVALAGAAVATVVWLFLFYIYIKTGFRW